uniref:Uncharacterized protein n=1 Tax=Pyramimonas obovata TaxID=1411642 RepID=A0A7S0WW51_9CHLO|mmetsp:Transcript_7140/g.14474  ORF Transcript_7140/g.14474 Transcript_7140/m.14474 type:complete len:511 (+) Transcript_7140:73-1605(+)|eukprot:CAMPEP_0118938718 /NCGR_PEP_ID=MMETSP1169-20130426/26865_1 /TAXON_ID=36882 /ORGANISM="Pyramimonas obovata, Strain CCMP722" /LENGTH=510 /DNA_ID=CAMNT_0006882753 /DNA_START=24 /DNA_END=1556 /DNA_ORIENTATION=-
MGTQRKDENHVHNFWGLSAPLDFKYLSSASRTLQAAMEDGLNLGADQSDKLAVLQVAPSDPRHTLLTMARAWRRQPEREVQMTVWESSCESLARHMVLISIILDTDLTPRERMEVFLEVYGNIKIRDKTAEYLEERGKMLGSVVLDSSFNEKDGVFNRLFDFSQLKYKEKDELVEVLRSYSRKQDFNMDAAWDWRCRKFYGERYDHLKNLVDWDYHMRLAETGATIVHFVQFREYRKTGIAFEIRDSRFTEPNRTLLSTAYGRTFEFTDRLGEKRGRSVSTRGLYTDMQCSPYLAFGVESDAKDLFRKANKEHIKTAVDVTEFNMESLIHEMYMNEKHKYIPSESERARYGTGEGEEQNASLSSVAEEEEGGDDKDPSEDPDEVAKKLKEEAAARAQSTAGRFRITLATGDLAKNVFNKNANKGAFDVIGLGCWMVHRLQDGLDKLAKPNGVLAVEDARYMLSITKEQAALFDTRVDELAKENGWSRLGDLDEIPPVHHIFTLAGKKDSQ